MNIENNNYEFFDFSDGNVPPEDPFLSGKIRFEGSDSIRRENQNILELFNHNQYHTRSAKKLYLFIVLL